MLYTIETEIWEDVPDKPSKVRYVKQRPANEVFKELKDYLKKNNFLTDNFEFFSLGSGLEKVLFPKGMIFCYACYGSNEGIYLNIDIFSEIGIIHFATGKILDATETAMDKMFQIAAECTKVFSGVNVDETTGLKAVNDNSNVKKVTSAEIMALTNTDKRKEFIANYEAWGIWINIPELNAKYFKAEFPDGSAILVGEFENNARSETYDEDLIRYHLIRKGRFFNPSADSEGALVEKLKDLKLELLKPQDEPESQTNQINQTTFF